MTSAAPADHFQDCGWHQGGRSGVEGRVGNGPRTPRLACPPRRQVARALRSDSTFSVSDGTIYEITLRSFFNYSGFGFIVTVIFLVTGF